MNPQDKQNEEAKATPAALEELLKDLSDEERAKFREDEQQKLIEKYDAEARYRNVFGWTKRLVAVLGITLSAIAIYTAGFGLLPEWIHRCTYLSFVLPLVFLLYPMSRGGNWKIWPVIQNGLHAIIGASLITLIAQHLLKLNGSIPPILWCGCVMIVFYWKQRPAIRPRIFAPIDLAIALLGLAIVFSFAQQFLREPTLFTTSNAADFKLFVWGVIAGLVLILGVTVAISLKRLVRPTALDCPDLHCPTYFDWLAAWLAAAACTYIIVDYNTILQRAGQPVPLDLLLGGILIVLVLEASRRSIGAPLSILALLTLMVAFYGRNMAGVPVLEYFAHRGYSVKRIIEHMYLGTEGIYGIPTGVVATYVFHFVLLGYFVTKTGLGQLFIDLAMGLAGWSAGGPAKVSVVSSALLGMISGSSVANVVTDGVFNIPLMKKLGYKKDFAGAVEASASTGGQITPPVMGAAAFIMAEFLGIPYIKIVICAILPALIYYYGAWIQVHLEARRLGIKGLPREQLPNVWQVMRERSILLLPLFFITYLLLEGRTPYLSAFWAILIASSQGQIHKQTRPFLVTLFLTFPFIMWLDLPTSSTTLTIFWVVWGVVLAFGVWRTWQNSDKLAVYTALALNLSMPIVIALGARIFYAALIGHLGILILGMFYKESKMRFPDFLECLEGGARSGVAIGAAVAAVGFIVGTTTLTGLGLKFSQITIDLSSAIAKLIQPVLFNLVSLDGLILFFTLIMTGVACIILGMGVPTTAQYIITSMIAAPALSHWGIPQLLTHMFVLYYGVLADITPPVALAAYAAAGISGGNPFKTGFHAMRISMGNILAPFYFVYAPSLLLMPWLLDPTQKLNIGKMLWTLMTLCLGMLMLSATVAAYFRDHLRWYERILFLGLTIGFLIPEFWSTIISATVMAAAFFWQRRRQQQRLQQAAT